MTNAEARQSVLEEVRLIVVEAKRDGTCIRADWIARVVASTYKNSGLGSAEIAERIKRAAGAEGVPVEHPDVAWAARSDGTPAGHRYTDGASSI